MKFRQLKVLYVLGSTSMDGSTISFRIIVDEMIKKNYKLIVLVSNRNLNKEFIDFLMEKGCKVEYFNGEMSIYPTINFDNWHHSFIKFPWKLIKKIILIQKSIRQVSHAIQKHNPDLIHTNVGVFPQAAIYAARNKIPHLWHLREYQTKGFDWHIYPSLKKFKSRLHKSYVLAISEDILKHFDLENYSRAYSAWNGILPKASVSYKHQKEPIFLCANRISPQKGLETAILAFGRIANKLPRYKLRIIGISDDVQYKQKLNGLILSLGCKDQIEILDFRPDVVTLMEKASALIVASHFEGLGRMTLEASFKGCLVLGRNCGGTKEIISRTKGGYLFDSAEELSEQMLKIGSIAETGVYKEKVLCAQKMVSDICSNENYGDYIHNLYLELLQTHENS